MTATVRRLAGASMVIAGAVAAIGFTAGNASAAPTDCVTDRWTTGASAHCGGDGFFTVEVDCVGVYVTRTAPHLAVGPYMQASQRFAYAGDHPEMDPTQTHPRADCFEFTTGHFGIATGTRVYETFR
ncbi:hypothetical protein [Nocardia mexicana]|uniref:Uncharacterized protein n=1 Tax=Nocardia mexicana TaxID=279262 RepID=A0A370GSW3_9NOCA|nr:hypothetical protein [Nocardia mexicana]RDI46788.1 hypothetical protein DFR68_110194 [Nocardia mexicana]